MATKPTTLEIVHAARATYFAALAEQAAKHADLAERAKNGDRAARAELLGVRVLEPPPKALPSVDGGGGR
jgi:hypothetical protein